MSKKDENMKQILDYLTRSFPDRDIVQEGPSELEDKSTDEKFYVFRIGGQYTLVLHRTVVETDTTLPILEGKDVAQKMKENPGNTVVVDLGPTGKGTRLGIKK